MGYNEATGQTSTFTVTAVIIPTDPLIVDLTIDHEQIHTTPEHPFFVLLRGWVTAIDLQQGDQVRRLDGQYEPVQQIAVEAHPQV